MASIAIASDRDPVEQDWLDEMRVTFDTEELTSFYDTFLPLELDDDGMPRLPE